jgi:cytidyltransferase-like protein
MVADLFHHGHVEFLKSAKELGSFLKVGIHSDETVESYKRKPICNMDERIKVVRACKYVDEVIENAPLVVTKEYIIKNNIDMIVHGDDISQESINEMYSNVIDK